MPVVFEDLDLPDGTAPRAAVDVTLSGPGGRSVLGQQVSTGHVIAGTRHLRHGNGIDDTGLWQIDLPGNDDIAPANTTWRVHRSVDGGWEYDSYLSVPVTGGPYQTLPLEVDTLNAIDPSALAAISARVGEELFHVEQTANQGPITSTSFVDVTSLTATITVPDQPFFLWATLPLLIEGDPVTGHCEARIVHGATPSPIVVDRLYARVASTQGHLQLAARIPAAIHTPTAGESRTYKVQFRSSENTNEVSTFVAFGGLVDVCQFRGFTIPD